MATRKTKIEKMFDKRKATYDKHTSAIIESIAGVIDGIKMYATASELLTDDNEFEVLATSVDRETKYVFIVGSIMPNIGTTVMSPSGEKFDVEDENDQAIYAKTLQINIAPEIVEQNNADATVAYIELANANMKKLQDELAVIEAAELEDSDNAPKFADFAETTPVLSEADKKNEEKLRKILEGATNPSGMFN